MADEALKGGKTDLPSKMKELDYWYETKAETSGQKNLFAQAGTPSGEVPRFNEQWWRRSEENGPYLLLVSKK